MPVSRYADRTDCAAARLGAGADRIDRQGVAVEIGIVGIDHADALTTVRVASSFTAPVSSTALGPSLVPVTVITSSAVSVPPLPSLTV